MPIEWERPLSQRRGASRRLGGIQVYYDFDWPSVFRHDRAVFPRGQSLSDLVRRDCPEGKQPTLLLTAREDVTARIDETADHYIVIVPIHDYLRNAGADAASTYYARLSGAPLTQLPSLADVSFSPAELEGFLSRYLTQDTLANWAVGSSKRMEVLRRILDERTGDSPAHVVNTIRGLTVADARVLDAVIDYLGRFEGEAGVRSLLDRLTQTEDGRSDQEIRK